MSQRVFVAVFERADHIVGAARAARASGLAVPDAYTPHAVHGLDAAMGLRPSRLPWVCFLAGLAGALFMMWFQLWTSAVDWRLNVGGRPWNSSLSFACVAFEVMVLTAGLTTVFVFLVVARLRPGRRASAPAERVNDDQYALLLEPRQPGIDEADVRSLLRPFHPVSVEECLFEEGAVA